MGEFGVGIAVGMLLGLTLGTLTVGLVVKWLFVPEAHAGDEA